MGGDGADLQFDRVSVAKFTQGVGATIDELGELGGATGSVMGKGFSELSMTGMEAGHQASRSTSRTSASAGSGVCGPW